MAAVFLTALALRAQTNVPPLFEVPNAQQYNVPANTFHTEKCELVRAFILSAVSVEAAKARRMKPCATCKPLSHPQLAKLFAPPPPTATSKPRPQAGNTSVQKPPVRPQQITPSKWVGGASSRSPMDDSESFVFQLTAENQIQGWLKTAYPVLVVRCQENKSDAYITTGMPPNVEYGLMNQASVRVRFDDAVAERQVWTSSTDNEALFAPSPIRLIRRVAQSDRLRVEFTPFNASPQVMDFSVRGFGGRLDVLAKACQWPR